MSRQDSSSIRVIFLLLFGVVALVGILVFIEGFVQLSNAELSAAFVPRDVFFQRMNSASGLTGTGVLVALIGGIPFYMLLKMEPSKPVRHFGHRRSG